MGRCPHISTAAVRTGRFRSKKSGPISGATFQRGQSGGCVRKGDASYRSASRYGTSGNVE